MPPRIYIYCTNRYLLVFLCVIIILCLNNTFIFLASDSTSIRGPTNPESFNIYNERIRNINIPKKRNFLKLYLCLFSGKKGKVGTQENLSFYREFKNMKKNSR